jgi:hypothetical protein
MSLFSLRKENSKSLGFHGRLCQKFPIFFDYNKLIDIIIERINNYYETNKPQHDEVIRIFCEQSTEDDPERKDYTRYTYNIEFSFYRKYIGYRKLDDYTIDLCKNCDKEILEKFGKDLHNFSLDMLLETLQQHRDFKKGFKLKIGKCLVDCSEKRPLGVKDIDFLSIYLIRTSD